MAKKKNVATFLGPNKGLSIIGSHSYAFSGAITNGSGDTDVLLNFTTGSQYIVSKFGVGFGLDRTNDDMRVEISFNGVDVASMVYNNNYELGYDKMFDILIPPRTILNAQVVKVSGTQEVPVFLWMTGRVYDV